MTICLQAWRISIGCFTPKNRIDSRKKNDNTGSFRRDDSYLTIGCLIYLQIIFIMCAGDVKLNPGPSIHDNLTDKELACLAKALPSSAYYELGAELRIEYSQMANILKKCHVDYSDAILEVLHKWNKNQEDSSKARKDLAQKLSDVGLKAFGTQLLLGHFDNQRHLTDIAANQLSQEQLSQCTEDLKHKWSMSLCRIRCNPLEPSSLTDLDEIFKPLILRNVKKQIIAYEKLFTSEINGQLPRRVLIEGKAGSGKTTLCAKIARDWVAGRVLKECTMLVYVPLGKSNKYRSIGELVKSNLSDSNTATVDQLNTYIETSDKVYIIFDGLDEFKCGLSDSIIHYAIPIIRNSKLHRCRVLVTTRPHKTHEIVLEPELRSAYLLSSVEGFDKDNLYKYVKSYFNDSIPEDLRVFMNQNEKMCQFPLFSSMLCVLWRKHGSSGNSEIQKLNNVAHLLNTMIKIQKEHYLLKSYAHKSDLRDLEKNKKNREDLDQTLLNIGRAKLLKCNGKTTEYSPRDIAVGCSVGIISEKTELTSWESRQDPTKPRLETTVSFLHELFGDYLSGLYLASIFRSNNARYSELINNMIQHNIEYFKHILGFTGCQGPDISLDIINRLITKDNEFLKKHLDLIVEVVHECNNEDAARRAEKVLLTVAPCLDINQTTSADHIASYLYVLQNVETISVTDIEWDKKTSLDFAETTCSLPSLRKLWLSKVSFHSEFYRTFQRLAINSTLQNIVLSTLDLQESPELSRSLAKSLSLLPQLNDLVMFDVSFNETFYATLAELSKTKLEMLVIRSARIRPGSTAATGLEKWIRAMPCLKTLTLGADLHWLYVILVEEFSRDIISCEGCGRRNGGFESSQSRICQTPQSATMATERNVQRHTNSAANQGTRESMKAMTSLESSNISSRCKRLVGKSIQAVQAGLSTIFGSFSKSKTKNSGNSTDEEQSILQ